MTALSRTAEFGITGVFEVGGHVRDGLLGLVSKDIDYAVEAPGFEAMRQWVHATHKQVFLEKPEFLTIRALTDTNQPVDYVMCRRDGAYSDSRRPDSVEPGTIFDDLARRDFTINAIARNLTTGELIDPHGGQHDLAHKWLVCVGQAEDRFKEDPLRIVRAIRFCVTKGFVPNNPITAILHNYQQLHDVEKIWWPQLVADVEPNRVREELTKCFAHDTVKTLKFLSTFVGPEIVEALFGTSIWLKPTSEGK